MLDFATLLTPFAITLAIGILIGAERESLKVHSQLKVLAGLRTFTFVSLLGFISAVVQQNGVTNFFTVTFFLLGIVITAEQIIRGFTQNLVGLTTAMALLLTFVLGGLTMFMDPRIVLALGIVVALVLSFKSSISHLLGIIPREAVLATVQFAVLSGAILPFLPNTYIDPWNFFNPYVAWWIVVLISGISFIGYILHLLLSSRSSILLTSAVGGLISSTAVTSTMAQLSQKSTLATKLLLTGCILTTTISAISTLIITTTINHAMFLLLVGPMATFALISGLFIWRWQPRKDQNTSSESMGGFKNPFQLKSALTFALVFVIIAFLAKTSTLYLGANGLYITSILVGLANVDAMSISISQLLATNSISAAQAMTGVILAILSSLWVKWFVLRLFAEKTLAKYMLIYTIGITLGTIITTILLGQFYFG